MHQNALIIIVITVVITPPLPPHRDMVADYWDSVAGGVLLVLRSRVYGSSLPDMVIVSGH